MNSYFEAILIKDPKEVEIKEKINKETEAFEASPEYKSHYERLEALWKEQDKAFKEKHERIKALRPRRKIETLTPEEEEKRENERKKSVAERKKRDWEELDPELRNLIERYKSLSKNEKRAFYRFTYEPEVEELPKAKNPKAKKEDMRDLERILVQTTIDFLKERGLDDVNEVGWGVDGLIPSVEYGEWTLDSDSSIHFRGYEKEEGDNYGYRTHIGEYL